MYVLIDEVYDSSYRAVQGAHAVIQYILEYGNKEWSNDYLIFLKTSNLEEWIYILNERGEKYSVFKEPDLNNKITAIAVYTEYGFKKLKMS